MVECPILSACTDFIGPAPTRAHSLEFSAPATAQGAPDKLHTPHGRNHLGTDVGDHVGGDKPMNRGVREILCGGLRYWEVGTCMFRGSPALVREVLEQKACSVFADEPGVGE
jgi:hypothetical protein